ncbi:thermonuclease family protein [Bacillus testis]|uniref:thermonuclease family protein n=1 Tax=Bacillus testis TaxID=1622072 RepID=UPI00067E7F5F|nr:thermonuclease family protein [Bacillus testis]
MKCLSSMILAVLLLAGCSNGNITENNPSTTHKQSQTSEAQDSAATKTISAKVVRVVDGDTFIAEINGKQEKVRLLLVDTPETVKANTPVQPFGPEASAYTKSLLTQGKNVQLSFDTEERDQYGRLLAYVTVDGKMLNELLLQKGLARVVVFKPNVKYVDTFKEIEKKAQQQGIGLWSQEKSSGSKKETTAQDSQQSCSNPTIKGNINRKGEKIYHLPGGQSYGQTKAEEMFCTENEAKAAGFRAAK